MDDYMYELAGLQHRSTDHYKNWHACVFFGGEGFRAILFVTAPRSYSISTFSPFNQSPTVRKVGGGRPRTTTAGDDRYIILQAKRGRRQSASVIAQQLSTATGRQVSWFTVARRLHKGGLFARRPERCLPLKVDHRCHRLSGAESTKTGQLTNRVVPSLWMRVGSKPEGGIMLNGRTELHILDRGSVTGNRYCEEVLLPHVRLFRGAIGPDFIFMDDNARPHWTLDVEELLESEDITRMDWSHI
ncbi:transposable element Tcb2 transposase [Trichonephila clavipes]|nr:transposable element Tcb2 transposase [Trichonephila clavipes]